MGYDSAHGRLRLGALTIWPGCGDHEGETGRGRVAGGATLGNSREESKDGHIAII